MPLAIAKTAVYSLRKARTLAVALAVTVLVVSTGLRAQQPGRSELPAQAFTIGLDEPLPVSPQVIVGQFDNGVHYYIRKNSRPSNRAQLRLVVDVGSILEDKDQLGLAHFLEHMAFNGTVHFEKQDLVGFMDSIGMRLGPDINAATSFDDTIFQLQIPMDNPEYLEKAFQILEDWATGLTLDSQEIDLERGVVIEEWRRGQSAQSRIRDKQLPVILKDSRYAERLPIGTLESLENFDDDALRRFYHDWYRPELMAVVAVGDFDPSRIEELLTEHFAHIPPSDGKPERVRYDVPEHDNTLYTIVTDPELSVTQVSVMREMPANTDWTVGAYRERIVERLYDSMLNDRFQQDALEPDAPFLAAGVSRGPLVRPIEAYSLSAIVPEMGVDRGLEALLVEAERVDRYGFTPAELEREKAAILRSLAQGYENRNDRTSASYAAEFARAYLDHEAIPGIAFEYALHERFLPGITLDEVDRAGVDLSDESDRIVSVTAPEKPGLKVPQEEELKEVIADAAHADIEPYVETKPDEALLTNVPTGSAVIDSRTREGGITEWRLANGVEVVLKPTLFQQDQIVFRAFSPGGTSLADIDDYVPASMAAGAVANGGLGAYSAIELQRELAGKVASVSPYFTDYEEGLRGGGSKKDLETLFQLIYLRMTAPRADEKVFESTMTQMRTVLANRDASPTTAFSDAFNKIFYENNPRRQPMTVERLQQANLDKSMQFYKDRFADASGFTFVFVGSFNLGEMRPFVEKYLGGLPANGRKESWKDVGIRNPTGVFEETVRRGLEPKSQTQIAFTGPFDYDDDMERVRISAVAMLLETRLRNVMREELGGTYSVNVGANIDWRPVQSYAISIGFGSDPARADELEKTLLSEIEALKQEGPTDDEVADTLEAMRRSFETSLEQNGFWLSQLASSYSRDPEFGASKVLSYLDRVNRLDRAGLRRAFRRYFDEDNYIRVTLLPED